VGFAEAVAEAAAPCAAGLLALSLPARARARPTSSLPRPARPTPILCLPPGSLAARPVFPRLIARRRVAEELGLPLRPTLLAFPQYLTYSLPARIAPRAAAAAALGARRLPLTQLAVGEAAWVRWLRVPPEEWWAFEEQWQGSPQAQRWAAAADT
jgi:hypothetical protein